MVLETVTLTERVPTGLLPDTATGVHFTPKTQQSPAFNAATVPPVMKLHPLLTEGRSALVNSVPTPVAGVNATGVAAEGEGRSA